MKFIKHLSWIYCLIGCVGGSVLGFFSLGLSGAAIGLLFGFLAAKCLQRVVSSIQAT